jgi:hypothetical protein
MRNDAISLKDFWGVLGCLAGDAAKCMKGLDDTADDDAEGLFFWRRMYALAVFSFFDGVTYRMIFHAYAARERRDVTFSLEELTRLEKYYDFDEDAEPATTFSESRMLEDIKFAFNAFARVHYSDYILPINDPEWGNIEEVASLKSFLQYPKTAEGLEVFEENVDTLVVSMQWYVERILELLESSQKHIEEKFAAWEAEDEDVVM